MRGRVSCGRGRGPSRQVSRPNDGLTTRLTTYPLKDRNRKASSGFFGLAMRWAVSRCHSLDQQASENHAPGRLGRFGLPGHSMRSNGGFMAARVASAVSEASSRSPSARHLLTDRELRPDAAHASSSIP
jgi:hypothetical protein